MNSQRPQKQAHTNTREDKNPHGNQTASNVLPPSSIAEATTTNDSQTPSTIAAWTQIPTQQDSSPPDAASDGKEQDPIPGWDEMAKIPKGREDEHITNDLTQQAGMVDPDPLTEEDTDEETSRRRQARNSTVQEAGERPLSGHLLQSGGRRKGTTLTLVPNDLRR